VNSLPASLVSYRQRLEDAIRHDLRARRARRRRTVVRFALAGAAASAVALGVVSLVSNHAPGAVSAASAGSVMRHAAAALAQSPGTILHVKMTGTQRNGDGSTVTWRDESWQLESAPYDRRQIETGPDGSTVESTSGAHGDRVYDSSTNTIYVGPRPAEQAPPQANLERGPRPHTYILRLRKVPPLVISAREAEAFRKGTLRIAFRKHDGKVGLTLVRASSLPAARDSSDSGSTADPGSPAFREQILALLSSGGARVDGHKTIDGHDTIEISSEDGHTTYYVDPASYNPVELDTAGRGGGVSLRFHTYDALPAARNDSLLDLEAQHPHARVDRSPSDYEAAQTRLFPHG
jgi:hypothetical protein